jgi:hypothetical protein
MTLNLGRKHWVVFTVLLAMQIPGMVITARRSSLNVNGTWIYFGLFAVPRNAFGYFIAAEMVLCLCFVTALIMVTLWDAVRQANR